VPTVANTKCAVGPLLRNESDIKIMQSFEQIERVTTIIVSGHDMYHTHSMYGE
jgi:hypothetical protein